MMILQIIAFFAQFFSFEGERNMLYYPLRTPPTQLSFPHIPSRLLPNHRPSVVQMLCKNGIKKQVPD